MSSIKPETVPGIFDPTVSVVDGRPVLGEDFSGLRVSENGGIWFVGTPSEKVPFNRYKPQAAERPKEEPLPFLRKSFFATRLSGKHLWSEGNQQKFPEHYSINAFHGGIKKGEKVPTPVTWKSNLVREIFEVSSTRLIVLTISGTVYLLVSEDDNPSISLPGATQQSGFLLDQNTYPETAVRPFESQYFDAEIRAVHYSGVGWVRQDIPLEKCVHIPKKVNQEGFFKEGTVPGIKSRPITHIFPIDNKRFVVVTKSYSLYFCTVL